ncbi:MAG: hypothetical protein JXD22_13580 [Sedimentisphaerales bacterium]|nr:hypothetical protein [Sedimentisphaerales bacterium]
MSKISLTSILVLMMCVASTSAYYEDFEDAGSLDGSLYGPTDNAPPVVSGGFLNTDYVDSGFLANGDYADFSGYMTFNFGGDNTLWATAAYIMGADGSYGSPNFVGALSGILVEYLPQQGWMYILQEWNTGATWSTIYLEQSGMVNPAGYSASTDYELHVVYNGDGTITTWVQEAANPANKGHVYTNIDISGATFYGNKVAVSGNFTPGVGGIDDLNIGSANGLVGNINTGDGIEVRKGSAPDTYLITITEAPPTNPSFPGVRVFLDVDDLEGQIEVDPSNPGTFDPNNALDILFTSANWSTPVTVSVTAVDDTGSETLTLHHSLVYVDSGYSPDPSDPQADCWTSPYLVNSTIDVKVIDAIEVEEPKFRAVYQRNDSNIAFVPVSGTYVQSPVFDSMQARYVLKSNSSVSGSWEEVNFSSGSFSDTIVVPAGGWYDIEIRALSGQNQVYGTVVEKVGVGEVFITSGQSNSVNSCDVKFTPSEDIISAWTWNDGWQHAADPQPTLTVDYGGLGGSAWSRLGSLLVADLNIPIAFITTGYAGSMVSEWLPTSPKQLYPRLEQALDAAGTNGVRAVLWHQGEQDSYEHTSTLDYVQSLTVVINAMRQYADWQVPWGIAIAAYPGDAYYVPAYVQAINDAQLYVTDTVPAVFEGPYTDDLIGIGIYRQADSVHFNDAGENEHALRWKSPILRRINRGDFEPDGDIDFLDFASLANKWLMTDCGSCDYADLNDDGDVDLLDLSDFSHIWLNQY